MTRTPILSTAIAAVIALAGCGPKESPPARAGAEAETAAATTRPAAAPTTRPEARRPVPHGREAIVPDVAPTELVIDAAFPPTLSDTDWHRNAWAVNDCLRCHETGVAEAPRIVHRGLPEIAFDAKCRTCHVLLPGTAPRPMAEEVAGIHDLTAFPPMMPNSEYHRRAWAIEDCLMCHETGVLGAPIARHEGMPAILLDAKCRSCHVQPRAIDSDAFGEPR